MFEFQNGLLLTAARRLPKIQLTKQSVRCLPARCQTPRQSSKDSGEPKRG